MKQVNNKPSTVGRSLKEKKKKTHLVHSSMNYCHEKHMLRKDLTSVQREIIAVIKVEVAVGVAEEQRVGTVVGRPVYVVDQRVLYSDVFRDYPHPYNMKINENNKRVSKAFKWNEDNDMKIAKR